MVKNKKCIRCGESKNLDEFYKNKSMQSGRVVKCKLCVKIENENRRSDPEFKTCLAESQKTYALQNKNQQCNQCGIVKDLGKFGKNKGGKTGIENKCKSCVKIKIKEYRASPEFGKRMEKLQKTNTKKGKICTMCGKYRKLDKFYNCITSKDGYAWDAKNVYRLPKNQNLYYI